MLLILLVLLSCGVGCADSGGLAISGKTGTLGLGGELTTGITPNVNARVGLNTLGFDFDDEIQDELDAFKFYPVLSIGFFYRF